MADREHIVRYVAVLDASNFFQQMQAMKKRLEAVNKSAVGSDDFQNKIDSQTASLREQGKAADEASKSNKAYSGVLKELGKNLASVKRVQREASQETQKHARVAKQANRELALDQQKLTTKQEAQYQRGLAYLQNYAFRRRQILNTIAEDQKSVSTRLRASGKDINQESKFITQIVGGSSGNGNKIAKNVGFLGGLAKSLVLLKGLGIYAIAVSLQALISAVAAAGGALVVFANAIAQFSSVAASVPGLIAAIGTAAISVKVALGGIGEAFKLFGNENNKAPTTFAEALERLHPAARKVVSALTGMYPAWQKVQKATQGEFFKPLVGQLGNIKSLLPTVSKLLTSAAGAVGRVAARGVEMMSSGPWQASFAKLANTNVDVIENLGDAALSVVDGFRKIADAATPLTTFVGSAVKGLADDFNGWTDTLNEGSFSKGQTRLTQFISIFKSFGSVIKSVFSAAGDTTDWLMDRFDAVAKNWANVTKNASQDGGKLKKFFDDLKPVLSETGKLFGDLFRGLAKLIDLPALAGTIAQIRTQLLPAVLRLIGVLGSPENLNGLVDTLTKLTDAASNLLESGLLQFFNNLVTTVGLVAAGFNALTSIPILGDLIKFVGTVGSYLAIGGIAVKVTANLVGNIQTLGRAAKKTAQALGLLKVVESVGGTAGGGKGLSKFTGLLGALPAVAGVSAGAIGGIAVGIAALSAAIAVGAVKLNDWADSNRINAKSAADWSKELQQNTKDLKTIEGMQAPTHNKIPGGYMQAPTTTTSFAQGTTSEQIAAYDRIQKIKDEIRDAIRVGDEGLKALDSTILSFATTLTDGGFEIFKDSIKQIGLSAEETAEKLPQVTSFLASYGVTVEQFKSDPFQQARIGAQSYFDTLLRGTQNAAIVEQANARLQTGLVGFKAKVDAGKFAQQEFYKTNAQGLPVLTQFGSAVVTQAKNIDGYYQKLISSGVGADQAKTATGRLSAQLYAALPAWARNTAEGQKLIEIMRTASTTPIEIQIQAGALDNKIAQIDQKIAKLSKMKATPEIALKLDKLRADKATAEKELAELEATSVDPTVEPKSIEEANKQIADLQKEKEALANITAVQIDSSAVSLLEQRLQNALNLKSQLGGGGKASGGESEAILQADGGMVPGQGDSDSVRALLTPGEYVIRKSAAKAIGYDNLEKLNRAGNSSGDSGPRIAPRTRYARGGLVGFKKGGKAKKTPAQQTYFAAYESFLAEARTQAKYAKMSKKNQNKFDANRAGNEAVKERQDALRARNRDQVQLDRATRDRTRAEQRLAEAIAETKAQLETMRETVAKHNSGFTERSAKSEVDLAKQDLRRVNRDSSATTADRESAKLRLEESEYRYQETLKQIEKDKENLATLEAAGIEGSDAVISARDALQDFAFTIQDLQLSLVEANKAIPVVEGGTLKAPAKKKANKKTPAKKAKKRALGGMISKLQPYVVGEVGPELVIPQTNGRVITAAQTRQLLEAPGLGFSNVIPKMPLSSPASSTASLTAPTSLDQSTAFTVGTQSFVINNPVPERATDSIQKTLKKITSRAI